LQPFGALADARGGRGRAEVDVWRRMHQGH
jgi:hypothetical protein